MKDLLAECWMTGVGTHGLTPFSPLMMGSPNLLDIHACRPDFRGALFQFLIGLLQTAYAPEDQDEWRERLAAPPDAKTLEQVFNPYRHAFLLENDGPAFLQDLSLPVDVNQLPVHELLIDAGSDSNLHFNKQSATPGMCDACFAQALLTLQLNAPSGGRGIRTSLRGGGPLTVLLLPAQGDTTLWQKLWLNVLPWDALTYPPVKSAGDVLPWLAPTRTSDGKNAADTPPEAVHPLQTYWGMPRRIRRDDSTLGHGDCAVCGAAGVRLTHHYRTRHGGTNYTGAWKHPLTPYSLDPKGEKPPLPIKGRYAQSGYRNWLGLVLGKDDHQPDAAQVVSHYTMKIRQPRTRLWCFGYDMSNMKAECWYDSTLPVHSVPIDQQSIFVRTTKELLDVADETAKALRTHVKAAWFKRPGDVKEEPAIAQSFWQESEIAFYYWLERLSTSDVADPSARAEIYRGWLLATHRLALSLFERWAMSAPIEDMNLERVVKARSGLVKQLNHGKATKPLWKFVNEYDKEHT
ncbi:MAG: type I-E CRISPR-associated protein Cse1/CasA [Zoogloeaceae bacterium]|jgi:CRISPR system Cascade subunit CasA|nr:type I-E CRISPR-associated protein Cse1/CasA [Zoogloeaceae bacterium]